jgi:hypothetical protein
MVSENTRHMPLFASFKKNILYSSSSSSLVGNATRDYLFHRLKRIRENSLCLSAGYIFRFMITMLMVSWTDKYKARELQLFGCQKLQFSFLMFDEWMTNGASGRRWQWLGRLRNSWVVSASCKKPSNSSHFNGEKRTSVWMERGIGSCVQNGAIFLLVKNEDTSSTTRGRTRLKRKSATHIMHTE